MKNTLAVGILLAGAILAYSGFKNWTIADTLRFFTGQEMTADDPLLTPEEREKLAELLLPDPNAPAPAPGTIENGGVLPGVGPVPPTAAGGAPDGLRGLVLPGM